MEEAVEAAHWARGNTTLKGKTGCWSQLNKAMTLRAPCRVYYHGSHLQVNGARTPRSLKLTSNQIWSC